MAVSKRLRFEVLRRDNHTCRYCGGSAPDVTLTVDHVIPVALGGSDDPTNLVAACKDCNAGKTSSNPDAPLVDTVADDALRWAAAMERAAELRAGEIAAQDEFLHHFDVIWTKYWITYEYKGETIREHAPRPNDWKHSVLRFAAAGLDINYFARTIRACLYENRHVDWDNRWRYFCGVAWRELDARRDIAASLLQPQGDD